MKHCVHCGEEIADDADVCPSCGTDQRPTFEGDDDGEEGRAEAHGENMADDRDERVGQDSPAEYKYCPKCGSQIDSQAELCPECGVRQPDATSTGSGTSNEQVVAGLLAILLGWFGVHKFYQGNMAWGVIYLCFFWTGLPGLLGLIEGILMLVADEEEYYEKYADGSILGA